MTSVDIADSSTVRRVGRFRASTASALPADLLSIRLRPGRFYQSRKAGSTRQHCRAETPRSRRTPGGKCTRAGQRSSTTQPASAGLSDEPDGRGRPAGVAAAADQVLRGDEVAAVIERIADPRRERSWRSCTELDSRVSVALRLTRRDINERTHDVHAAGTEAVGRDRMCLIAKWARPIVTAYRKDKLAGALLWPGSRGGMRSTRTARPWSRPTCE